MKLLFSLLIGTFLSISFYAQSDSLRIGDKYWEDQLYISLSYNIIQNQPDKTTESGFSYSFSLGYIKDIPLNKEGTLAIGIGAGYGYNSFNHGLQIVDSNTIQIANNISSNKIDLHNLEFPIQIRWRTSDAVKYSFWRIYGGLKFDYNLSNSFSYIKNEQTVEFNNMNLFNNFQSGIELSTGYGAFNLYIYYGLSSMYKNAVINSKKIDSKIVKFGLIFYLL